MGIQKNYSSSFTVRFLFMCGVFLCSFFLLSGRDSLSKQDQTNGNQFIKIEDNVDSMLMRKLLNVKTRKAKHKSSPTTTVSNEGISESIANTTGAPEKCTPPAYHEFPKDAFTNDQLRHGAAMLHVIMVMYMFLALAITCDDYFVSSLEKICEKLGLSEDVAGATFMAAGSSAPELFTSIIGVFIAKGDVGVGTIVGSAVFNILFVIGICALLSGQIVQLTWWPLVRDSTFYSISVIALMGSIADGWVTWYESLIMLLLYVIYIVFMRYNTVIQDWMYSNVNIFGKPTTEDTSNILPPPTERKFYGNYEIFSNDDEVGPKSLARRKITAAFLVDEYIAKNPPNRLSFEDACFRFMIGKRFKPLTRFRSACRIIVAEKNKLFHDPAFLKRQRIKHLSCDSDSTSYTKAVRRCLTIEVDEEAYDDWMRLPPLDQGLLKFFKWVVMYPIKGLLYFTIPDCRKQRWDRWWMVTFIMSIVWIAAFSYLMVWMVTVIGFTLNIPDSVMGITFLAAGTSVPDAMASVMVARQGQGDMAVSNTIGSNVFDILIGLALPWFLKTALTSPGTRVHINSNGMIVSVVLLFLTVFLTIGSIHLRGWRLDKKLGIICLTSYAVFLMFSIMTEMNVFGFVNAPMCRE